MIPAIVVGAASGLLLLALSEIAKRLEGVMWTTIPDAIGVSGTSGVWTFAILTLTGLAIGLVVTFVPGHAGPDPATLELMEPPMPVRMLPSLALAAVLMLAGGVSLGPENPILAINVGLAVAIGLRLTPKVPGRVWGALAFAGTIGALFGTPVGAALLLAEVPGDPTGPLWDRMFAPLLAAAAGSVTMILLGGETFAIVVAPYPATAPIDLLTGAIIAVAAAVIGLAAVYAFPVAHAAFKRLGPPLISIVVGGAILGVLGVIGGQITLFKGLEQMQTLAATVDDYTVGGLALVFVVKLVALVVAGTSGFRGGRIFPSVFIAVALGLFIYELFPQVPEAVAISASLIGILLAVTRSGWIALFMAALLVGDTNIFPLLCVIVLPAWLVVTGKPLMVVRAPEATAAAQPAAN